MARKPPRLKIVLTPAAQRDLEEIWSYNCRVYDPDHADDYIAFLERETKKLTTEYLQGRIVPAHPDYRYLMIRKGRGHGHIAVYQALDQTVEILRYFHTARDWQSEL